MCTCFVIGSNVSDASLRNALMQLSCDFIPTIFNSFMGHRRVLFGVIGTASQLRFCQMWSVGAYLQARVSSLMSIATAEELATLLANPVANWCDVVATKSAFLKQIARVVLHSATRPTIDSGEVLPSRVFRTEIGDLRLTDVIECNFRTATSATIVVGADLRKSDGTTVRVALTSMFEGVPRELAALTEARLPGVVTRWLARDLLSRVGLPLSR
jgi:hypothetical protein